MLGSKELFIPPQTSTVASHLPKAVGAAYSIGLNKKLRNDEGVLPHDGAIICSFGDASVNHSTSQGAFNTAGWTAHQGVPVPIVFVCEDNGIGISTFTPGGWVAASMGNRPGLKYFSCNGLNLLDTYRTAHAAEDYVRKTRMPVFLHMTCVRLFGHAGADAQHMYMTSQAIEESEAQDPLLDSARLLIENEVMASAEILDMYNGMGERVARVAEEAIKRPKMKSAAEVMESIIPPKKEVAPVTTTQADREKIFGDDFATMKTPQTMAKLISWALADVMLDHSNIVCAGRGYRAKRAAFMP